MAFLILLTLPQVGYVGRARVEPFGAVIVGERRVELRENNRLGAAAEHGANHGGNVIVPAVVAHRPPAAVTVDLHFTRAAVQTSRKPDGLHLCGD